MAITPGSSNAASREIVAQASFEQRQAGRGERGSEIVAAFDEALGAVMKEIVVWTVANPALSASAQLAILDPFCSRGQRLARIWITTAGLRVSRDEIEQMTAAAAVIRECRRDLAARGDRILEELTAGSPQRSSRVAALSRGRGLTIRRATPSIFSTRIRPQRAAEAASTAISTSFCGPKACRPASRR